MTASISRFLLAAAAAAACGLASPVAASAKPGTAFRVAIPVADLDLESEAGRRELLRRSRAAAQRTCAPDPYPVVYDAESLKQCRDSFARAAQEAIARVRESAARGTR